MQICLTVKTLALSDLSIFIFGCNKLGKSIVDSLTAATLHAISIERNTLKFNGKKPSLNRRICKTILVFSQASKEELSCKRARGMYIQSLLGLAAGCSEDLHHFFCMTWIFLSLWLDSCNWFYTV